MTSVGIMNINDTGHKKYFDFMSAVFMDASYHWSVWLSKQLVFRNPQICNYQYLAIQKHNVTLTGVLIMQIKGLLTSRNSLLQKSTP